MSRIVFDGVSKVYPGAAEPAVDDVSFEVEDGELVVVLGPSGCGKTTLLKTVNRLVEPTSGRILVGDVDVTEQSATDLRRRIGYVIQQVGLFPHMTVSENVATVPRLLDWDSERIRRRVSELLDLVNLPAEQYADRYPGQLSGGQQQRVGVARALAGDPEVILMDEPFGSVDAITRERLQDEILELQATVEKTVLFVTHDVEEALRLADRIAVMRKGRLVQVAAPTDLLRVPASAFVAELVGADDFVRRLSLISVRSVMTPAKDTGNPAPDDPAQHLSPDDDLRQALSRVLSSSDDSLPVVEGDQVVGRLDLAAIRSSVATSAPTVDPGIASAEGGEAA